MDFFEHQERARRKTTLLVVYFVVAVALIVVAVYLAVAGVMFYGHNRAGYSHDTLWFPDVFAAVSLGTLAVVAVGSLFKMAQLTSGGEVVARSLGGRRVSPATRDLSERILLNVVEEMAIASGTPVPPVFLLEDEPGINAFAAGTSPPNAVIGITRGSVDTLSRDELQGVIAHEFSHILNGDMRLNIRLIGILNGILLISTIGYILMRTSNTSSSFSDSNGKKGGNPLPLLGMLLYVIGYIGVFFGHLIKSAVSRQREFLADASAVQFTRVPDGIAGALRKIGGLVQGSKIVASDAEEASHMFFGNGLTAPLFDLLATHPPLAERIRRIDPKFDGKFPRVLPVEHSPEELVDPHRLARLRAAGESVPIEGVQGAAESVHARAALGAQGLALAPAAAVDQVGEPRPAHLEYAGALVESLPPELVRDVRDPLGAVATIYALLLDGDEPDVRTDQVQYLSTKADPRAYQETARVAPFAARVPAEAKLPLVSMVLPALKGLSPRQLAAFREDVVYLIRADKRVSLFEYAVQRLVLKRLLPRLEQQSPPRVIYRTLVPLEAALGGLLSTLAHSGTRDESKSRRAFDLAAKLLPAGNVRIELLPRSESSLKTIDGALDQLAAATPAIKKLVLQACAECIGADEQVTIEEGELLRVISDALDCPMPPILDGR
jgi:Zn-dependent protease with chaperone function